MSIDNKKNPIETLEVGADTPEASRGHAERLAEEWQLAEDTFNGESVKHTISIFGSARIPNPEIKGEESDCAHMSPFYAQARELSFQLGQYIEEHHQHDTRLITGGGPGIMEAASRGAFEAGHASIGLNIAIPREQKLNPFIAAKHSIEFQYFALRKMHFLKRARALIVFPGGFGTLDELFETLTLIQTKKMARIPVILYGCDFWNRLLDFNVLSECGLIDQENLALYHVVDNVEEAFNAIKPVLDALK
ncbi:MAG TPA: TIGR00730 family Rossman fold protein [Aliidiomarina sp.]|nr:TIGR00730 family Rossman fold protein [Aliidiomarina sp.]